MSVPVRICNPEQPERAVSVDALNDTGATYSVIPERMAADLQLRSRGRRPVRTATGIESLTESMIVLELQDDRTETPALISPSLDIVLVGVLALEGLGLAVDPGSGRLVPTEILLL